LPLRITHAIKRWADITHDKTLGHVRYQTLTPPLAGALFW
jgi:hypothetical protein